jgi:sugar phosphate isomerase/epimerase
MEVAVRDGSFKDAGFDSGIDAMRYLGVSAVEVAIDKDGVVSSLVDGRPLNLTNAEDLETFGRQTRDAGMHVCTFLCSQNFNAPDPAPHLAWVVQAAHAAEKLGVPSLRIDSIMTGQSELPLEERIRIFADAAMEVLRATSDTSVALGIENHGPQGNDPEWMRSVIRRVGSPRLGLTLDVGNWYWYGHPLSRLYEIYQEFGPLVKATHVKNIAYPAEIRETQRQVGFEYGKYCCPLDEGDIDMAKVAAILRATGYDGPFTMEDESIGKFPQEQRAAIMLRNADHLRAAIAAG